MNNLSFLSVAQIISHPGAIKDLAKHVQSFKAQRVLIVTDPGLVKLGYIATVETLLQHDGIEVFVFDQIQADPPYEIVENATKYAKKHQIELIVAIGGGSSIDAAKIIAVCVNSDQSLDSMVGTNNIDGERLPLIVIPTTAGTGSEVTFVSVLTGTDGSKKAIYSPKIIPDLALLDAELTLNLPRHITAATALDAMVHAVEAYTSRTKKNVISDALAVKALDLLFNNYSKVMDNGHDLAARENMLLGSTLAGMAFVNASVAAVHGLSYPLGARFHVPHGHSNALVMGPIFRFNLLEATDLYAELSRAVMREQVYGKDNIDAATLLIETLENYFASSGLASTMSELGVTKDDLEPMAHEVKNKLNRLIETNPRDMSFDDVYRIYESIL